MLCHITPLSWTVMDRPSVATSSTLLHHPLWTWSDQLSGFTSTPSCMQSALALVLTTSTFHHCCLQPPPVLYRSAYFDDVCPKSVRAEEYFNWTPKLLVFPHPPQSIPTSNTAFEAVDLPIGIVMYGSRWVSSASASAVAAFLASSSIASSFCSIMASNSATARSPATLSLSLLAASASAWLIVRFTRLPGRLATQYTRSLPNGMWRSS
mmetsp:Transcript_2552/g.7082  ORF Transcript_2552/g.7082 Transcript_2552/m.7082 type:complete len:209 (+) Transcript_2552:694-1320(+)